MKPVAFIEGQQQLFTCHDDTDHLIAIVPQETTPSAVSPAPEREDDEASLMVDRYINQGFNPIEAQRMVFGEPSASESFGSGTSVVTAVAPYAQQRTQNRHQSRGVGRPPRRLSAREMRARDALPLELNER